MAKKGKKGKGDKLPKTIAGVTVPKELRSAGGRLARIMRDPATREVALAALTAALAVRKDNRKAARKVVGDASDVAEQAGRAAGWVKPALTAAAVEAGRMIIDAIDEGKKRGKQSASRADEGKAKPALSDEREGAPSGVTH